MPQYKYSHIYLSKEVKDKATPCNTIFVSDKLKTQ